ncbi:MAG: hypothetical protein UDQ50_02220 [Streptococcus lutetiensis]|uniref:hypothetical protein n=1 Tax=Streptococcus lutetiensis TaxID=150055 RepID=UPI002E1C5062|nr:hypothetical protein [Streptococcus lutetiensis]
MSSLCPMKENILAKFPDLKGIAVNATGINTIDCEYAEKLGIAIRNLGAHIRQKMLPTTRLLYY